MSAPQAAAAAIDLTSHWVGYAALLVFAATYLTVMAEERLKIWKSQPVIMAAGVIWALIAFAYLQAGRPELAAEAVRHSSGEYAELFLFILVAMTFVNTMEERQVFDALRAWLIRRRLTLRTLFWVTGLFAFFLSSQLDNLTTALVMGTVAITVGRGNPRFIGLACINVVVAANAGGAFSPFGDITTLMVWQAGRAEFWDFFRLFVPSLVNWAVPAFLMSFAVPAGRPEVADEDVRLRRGAWGVVGLFALTIVMAVSAYNLLKLPPVMGMITGLGVLKFYSWYLALTRPRVGGEAQPLGHLHADASTGTATRGRSWGRAPPNVHGGVSRVRLPHEPTPAPRPPGHPADPASLTYLPYRRRRLRARAAGLRAPGGALAAGALARRLAAFQPAVRDAAAGRMLRDRAAPFAQTRLPAAPTPL